MVGPVRQRFGTTAIVIRRNMPSSISKRARATRMRRVNCNYQERRHLEAPRQQRRQCKRPHQSRQQVSFELFILRTPRDGHFDPYQPAAAIAKVRICRKVNDVEPAAGVMSIKFEVIRVKKRERLFACRLGCQRLGHGNRRSSDNRCRKRRPASSRSPLFRH